MKQKIVIKVYMTCGKCRKKAMKIAASACGVISVAIQGNDKDQIVVIGDGVDSTSLTHILRKKVGYSILQTVEEVKEPKKDDSAEKKDKAEDKKGGDDKKDDPEKKPKPTCPESCNCNCNCPPPWTSYCNYPPCPPQCPPPQYCTFVDPNPSCSIM